MELNYAILNGRLVHVDEVKNGLECECLCPQCKELLIAKNEGEIKDHHFAHQSNSSCLHAYESMIHLLAKEVIYKHKEVLLPSLYARVADRELDMIIKDEVLIKVDSVVLEKKVSDIIPDVMVNYGGHPILIEIKVSHGIDEEKEEKIKSLGIDTIEVDLSGFKYVDERMMIDIMTNRIDCKKWIYNQEQSMAEKRLLEFSENKKEIYHGLALHVLDCPKDMRYYRGRSYANVLDDCSCCPYNISSYESMGDVRCIGKADIDSIEKLNDIESVEKDDGLITSIKYKDGKEKYFIENITQNASTIFDLWDSLQKPFLAKNIVSNVAAFIYKNPYDQYYKYRKCYGKLYKNGYELGDREIYGVNNHQWELITEEDKNE